MFGRPKVRLEPAVYKNAVERARKLGLPSVEAYIADLVQRDLKTADDERLRDTVNEKMKGLGYLQ
jgi:hypothetical protein